MSPTPDEFLADYPPTMRELANQLRALVRKTLPDSYEEVKTGWKLIAFYLPAKPTGVKVGFIVPHADSVTLGFEHGILLADPDGVLLGAGEKLKRVRYLSLRSAREVRHAQITPFVRQAAELSAMPSSLRKLAFRTHP